MLRLSLIFSFLLSGCSTKKTRQERESNGIISSVSDIVSVVQPSGLSLVLSYQLMESRVKILNSDISDYEETHQNDMQNMDSMLESIRSILIKAYIR